MAGLTAELALEAVGPSVEQAIALQIESGTETGIQVAAYLEGRLVVDCWAGLADPVAGVPVSGATLFNVFSVAKPVTATALHIQAERGLVDYEAPVAEYWPEFAAADKGGITVRHVLSHRSGLPQMPVGMTPERLGDWEGICAGIAALEPLFKPGERTTYQALSFGWMIGEIVRRSDPMRRSFSDFIQDEICAPLGLRDFWFGLPDAHVHRLAMLSDANALDSPPPPNELFEAALPKAIALTPEVYGRPDVRRAMVPAVGLICNARSQARFWAMLANGGELDGVRLLSEERVRSFAIPRAHSDEPDPVMFGVPLSLSGAGFWLGGDNPKAGALRNSPRAIWHPGAGGSMGWADLDTGLAASICHNRMYNAPPGAPNPIATIAEAIQESVRRLA
jgi:CubicO group peptidase (beta-lactamase class C family)